MLVKGGGQGNARVGLARPNVASKTSGGVIKAQPRKRKRGSLEPEPTGSHTSDEVEGGVG